MPFEFDDQGLRVIGYNEPIQFYDSNRVLQQTIELLPTNELNIGAPAGGGGAAAGDGGVTDAQYVVLYPHAGLSNERVAVAGDGLGATDEGPGNNIVLYTKVATGLQISGDEVALDWSGTPTTIEPDDTTDAGSSSYAARIDHTHGIVAATPVSVDLAANDEGVATSFARSDHKHDLDESLTPTWTGGHTFQTTMTARHIQPEATDTYDLGSSSKLWRKGYLSELEALVFVETSISLVGGWLVVPRGQGTLPVDVNNSQTTIDFGKAMTVGDFLEFRAFGQVEYMEVGTLVSGTTYNVTRNLDGSGANTWYAGTAYLILGQSGDGRISLYGADPSISVIVQGATYNTGTTYVRIGNLNGYFGVASDYYGLGVGDYSGGNYLIYNTNDGFKITAGGDDIEIDADGITLEEGSSGGPSEITWHDTTQAIDVGGIVCGVTSLGGGLYRSVVTVMAECQTGVGHEGMVILRADRGDGLAGESGAELTLWGGAGYVEIDNLDQDCYLRMTGVNADVRIQGGLYVGAVGNDPPAGAVEILRTAGPQLYLHYTDGSVSSTFQVQSDGNLDIDVTGTGVYIYDSLSVGTDLSTTAKLNVWWQTTDTGNTGHVIFSEASLANTAVRSGASFGVLGRVRTNQATANITGRIAGLNGALLVGGTGTITISEASMIYGSYSLTNPNATITALYGIFLNPVAASATITNQYGLRIADIDQGASTNHAIYTGAGLIRFGDIINFAGTMGNSSKDPTTDAPADWVEVQIAGTTYYLPAYAA